MSNKEFARIQSKDPQTWTVAEVGMWLDYMDLSEHKIPFIENSISGAELFDLDDDDLIAISVKKLGHRKKILQQIAALKGGQTTASAKHDTTSVHSDDTSSGSRNMPSAASTVSQTEVVFKCYFNDDIRVLKTKVDIDLRGLKRKIRHEFKQRMSIKWKDSDGDMIVIRRDRHLSSAIKASGQTVRLILSAKKKSLVSRAETSVLENLVDGCVIIDIKGSIQFTNKAIEKMFGYQKAELSSQNVKILMPDTYAREHDQYLKSYLRTGEAHVMGTGRKVVGKKKDGTEFPVYLSLSETREGSRHTFTGTIQDLSGKEDASAVASTPDLSSQFSLLNNLLDTCVVIDEKGTIQFFNYRGTELLGFTQAEVIGRNVKILMPSPFSEQHDTYLRNYLTSNIPKIIGVGRQMIAQRKDGTIVPIHLSVTEQKLGGGKRLFTGILRLLEEAKTANEKSVLQQEREVLDNLVVAAVVIDQTGVIHGFNKAATELFGYSLIEVVGKNVKLLVPSPDKEKHDQYLANYISGKSKGKVVGVGRDLVGLHKSGTMLPIHLSVTQRADGDKLIFTGVVQKR